MGLLPRDVDDLSADVLGLVLRGFEERARTDWRRTAWLLSAWCSQSPAELLGEDDERPVVGMGVGAQLAEAEAMDQARDAKAEALSAGWVDRLLADPTIEDLPIYDDEEEEAAA